MAHIAKFQKGAIGNMFSHYDRSRTNLSDNIDWSKTHNNYNLAEHQTMSQLDFLHQRLSEVKVQNRKDVNIFCDWVVTVPKDLPVNEHKDFFKSSYDFLSNRYGKENIISAYVHNDENTPHMHFNFIPIVEDLKKGGYKVSAKERITRADLKSFHNDLSEHLEKELGHPVSILNDATAQGNKSINDLKRETAVKEINALQTEKQALQGQIKLLEDINLKINRIQGLKAEKGILGQIKGITLEDFEIIKKLAIKSIVNDDKIKKLENENKKLNSLIPSVSEKLQLEKKLQKLDDLEKLLKNIPSDIIYQYQPKNQNKSKTKEYER